ncbi:MAG: serine/threonine protein kinase [Aquincola sp.]|nr:serine/threonine protein kinase [Aquincola sp.]
MAPPPTGPADPQRTQLIARRDSDAALPVGTLLGELHIDGVMGQGGYSIVYRVRDTRLGREGAVKEFMPATVAQRDANGVVHARSPRHLPTFQHGLRRFFEEAKLLASFDHPALVKIQRVWADNGTAYLLMPLVQGPTLHDALRRTPTPPPEPWLRRLATELAGALGVLHAQQCLHRDVAPDNIVLQHDPAAGGSVFDAPPRPVLLDFGSARRIAAEAEPQQLTALLKTGYSPIEQYEGADGAAAAARQGPWTDVYALCAVLWSCLTLRAPPSAVARAVRDEMESAVRAGAGRYTPELLAAIDAGLAVRPEDRPPTMDALLHRLSASFPKTVMVPRKAAGGGGGGADVALPRASAGAQPGARMSASPPAQAGTGLTAARPRRRHRLGLVWALVAVLAMALLVGVGFLLSHGAGRG